MSLTLAVSLLLLGELQTALSSSFQISDRGSFQRAASVKSKARIVRREGLHREHLQPYRVLLEEGGDVWPLDAIMAPAPSPVLKTFVLAAAGETVCPDGTNQVTEDNTCVAAAKHLGKTDKASTPTHSIRFHPVPEGCFEANGTVYFEVGPGGICETCSLVCETITASASLPMFDKTSGGCSCHGHDPNHDIAIELKEDEQASLQECAEECAAFDACDAFEVDAPFASRCQLWTGPCIYNETSDEASEASECYIRKGRQEVEQANSDQ